MKNNTPIGIFDSGVGGLSVLSNIHRLLPNESLAYVADSLYAPYGAKNSQVVIDRSIAATDFLVNQQNAKMIVVGCNTATATAINQLRTSFKVPIIGMEPAVKPATEATIVNKVGVLATTGTLESAKFSALLASHSEEIEFYIQPCPGLVDLIEQGLLYDSKLYRLLKIYLEPFKKNNVDTIVLGCTHYIFIRKLIEELMGPEVEIIDTGNAVAKQVERKLIEFNLQNHTLDVQNSIWTNHPDEDFKKIIKLFLTKSNFRYKFFSNWS